MNNSTARRPGFRRGLQCLLVLGVAGFLLWRTMAQPFVVSSEAMRPTLLAGDWVLVNTNAYGNGLLSFGRKASPRVPARGDVVVFTSRVPTARVMPMPANHLIFPSNEAQVLRQIRAFAAHLPPA